MQTDTNEPLLESSFSQQPLFVISLLLSLVLLAVSIFRWTLTEWLTPLLEPMLELSLGFLFLCASLWSLVHFGLKFRKVGFTKAGIPLLINTATFIAIMFVPFARMTTALDFRWNYNKRMEVVSDVLDGRLGNSVLNSGGRGEFVHLPSRYRGLSAGGDDIMIYRRDGQTLIFFFDFRGIMDSFSGFVYSTGGAKPQTGDFGGQFFEVDQLRPNWYWASSAN